jgi:hypothetical protein
MSDINSNFPSLPVAPEFVEALAETATKTALDHLRKFDAPEELVALVENIHDLGYYLATCYRHPESLTGERRSRFDIETIVIEAVNAIAKLGGEFHGPYGGFQPRESAPAESGE